MVKIFADKNNKDLNINMSNFDTFLVVIESLLAIFLIIEIGEKLFGITPPGLKKKK